MRDHLRWGAYVATAGSPVEAGAGAGSGAQSAGAGAGTSCGVGALPARMAANRAATEPAGAL